MSNPTAEPKPPSFGIGKFLFVIVLVVIFFLLARINRELDADFVLERFEHVARFNTRTRSVEMHLRSAQDQTVTIAKAGISVPFVENETIWTETSHKYSPEEVVSMADDAGFRCEAQWIDHDWPFAENLLIA